MYLKLENVSKSFKNGNKITAVVDNISMDINKGELICLLGPSGCGKTTTLKMIGGFLTPDDGNIILNNEDITNITPEDRQVATVFQNYALFPNLNVIDNVIFGLRFKNMSKKEMLEKGRAYLKIIEMESYEKSKINQLSGGQQQRIALIRALITSPKVLLLDEPLSNLDAKLRIGLRNQIKYIKEKFGITMIFVTHDQEEAMAISDRIAVMMDGKIQQIGTPKQIYYNSKNERVMEFIGDTSEVVVSNQIIKLRPEQIILDEMGKYGAKITKSNFLGFYQQLYCKQIVNEKEMDSEILIVDTSNKKYTKNEFIRFSIKGEDA